MAFHVRNSTPLRNGTVTTSAITTISCYGVLSLTPMKTRSLGHAFFALTLIAIGIFDLFKGDFDATWSPVPKSMPALEVLIYLCALIYVVCGIGLLWRRTAAVASRVLFVYLAAWLLFLRVPQVFLLHPTLLAFWGFAKTAVLVAAAWVLYAWLARGFAAGDKGVLLARALYALALIPFGLAHFKYVKETVVLVPGWLPAPVFWAYFTGAAFIAVALAMLIGVFARLAAVLSVIELAAFALLVWLPRVIAGHLSAFQWGEVVVTIALTTAAWVVADSYRGMRWLAAGKR